MDEIVARAMAKWPDVPAVYGWLALDCRGRWRLDGDIVRSRNTVQYINRNYACDDAGRWYFQNGPQRAFVDLDYTPWVYVLDGRGDLRTHTGLAAGRLDGAWLDDEVNLLLATEHGPGIVCDRDLAAIAARFCDEQGKSLPARDLERVFTAARCLRPPGVCLNWAGRIGVGSLARRMAASRFGFDSRPRAQSAKCAPVDGADG